MSETVHELTKRLEKEGSEKNYDGLSKDKSKRSWRSCPRCRKETVSRDLRKCTSCNGVLAWYGDDCRKWDETMTNYYVWYKPPFGSGIEGWYDRSYFIKKSFKVD